MSAGKTEPVTRAGFVALLGAPNAGKSTLLNRMAGAKLSIVSPKAQTTRSRVLGIVLRDLADGAERSQVVLVDTPGIFKPRRALDRAMVQAAWTGAADADLAVLLVDSRAGLDGSGRAGLGGSGRAGLGGSGRAELDGSGRAELGDAVRPIVDRLAANRPPALFVVLNKVDLVAPPALLPLADELARRLRPDETFFVSALDGDGVGALLDALARAMPRGPFLYDPDQLTDLPDRLLAAELVREQVFLQCHDEVPYAVTVETENWAERPDGSVRVDATVYVARPGHKAIVIGDGGSRIRAIGTRARQNLATLLERPCHLFLNVKERPGWDEEAARLRAIGLEPER